MNREKMIPALFAIVGSVLGSLIVAGFALYGQLMMQTHETDQAMRRIAYESGVLEWKTLADNKLLSDDEIKLGPYDFINRHLLDISLLHERVKPQDMKSLFHLSNYIKLRTEFRERALKEMEAKKTEINSKFTGSGTNKREPSDSPTPQDNPAPSLH